MARTKLHSLRVQVVTPERTILDEEADFVAFPAFDGEVGVSPGRGPLVARLGPGELRLKNGSDVTRYFVDGGFGQVRDNVLTILTPRARTAAQLEVDDLRRQLRELNAEIATTEESQDDKAGRLGRVRAMLAVAERA